VSESIKKPGVPNCTICVHFFVTYQTAFPYACRLFGIQCQTMPVYEVYKSTGQICQFFEKKVIKQ